MAGGAGAGAAPGGGLLDEGVGAVTVQHFAKGACGVGGGKLFHPDAEDKERLSGFAGLEGGGVTDIRGRAGGERGHGHFGGGAGMDERPGELRVAGDVAEGFAGRDPGRLADAALSAQGYGHIGDAAEAAEGGLHAEGDGDGLRAPVAQGHAQEGSARAGGRAPGERCLQAVDGECGAGCPVGDEIPGRVAKGERLAVDPKVGLDGGGVVAGHLEQAAMLHGEDVEGVEGAVDGANVGQGDPLVAGGQHVVGAEVERLGAQGGDGGGHEGKDEAECCSAGEGFQGIPVRFHRLVSIRGHRVVLGHDATGQHTSFVRAG